MALIYPNIVRALFVVPSVPVAPVPGTAFALLAAAGVSSDAIYQGQGDFDVTLDQALAVTQGVFVGTPVAGIGIDATVSYEYVSDTVRSIRHFDAGVTDDGFSSSWAVFCLPNA